LESFHAVGGDHADCWSWARRRSGWLGYRQSLASRPLGASPTRGSLVRRMGRGGVCCRDPDLLRRHHDPPVAMYEGEPTGTAANDNARVIFGRAERVSNFR
jgi:hypothetical protein